MMGYFWSVITALWPDNQSALCESPDGLESCEGWKKAEKLSERPRNQQN